MYVLNGKFPFIHRLEEGVEHRGQVLLPWSTLDDWFALDGYQTNTAGITITDETALKHSAYWRAVNLLSSQIASFPIGLFRRLPNGDTEEITDHPAVKLLTRKPNDLYTPFIWRESCQANVLTRGNSYSGIDKNSSGKPMSITMLNTDDMKIRVNGGKKIYDYNNTLYDPSQILHIPGLSFDGIKGKSVLHVAAESMGVGLAMQKYSASFYKSGAKQSGFLQHPQSLSPEAIAGMRASFNKNMKDVEGGTMILDEGMKYQPNSTPPIDQQLLQLKQFSVQEIARWFGIPVHLLMEESRSTFNNIAEQGLSFIIYTLTQWVERWESELEAKLLMESERDDHFFKFNMNSLLRGNPKDRGDFISQMIQNGVLSINEGRKLEDLNSIEGGDKHYIQVNMQAINENRDGEGNAV